MWPVRFQYIALERLESIYKACNLVSNICVHADANAKQPIAIVIPHEQNLRHALEATPIEGVNAREEMHVLCASEKVQQLVMRECNALGKKNGFKSMELLEAVILTADEWTPESGLVTAAQKVQRKKVAEKFSAQIKACYRLPSPPRRDHTQRGMAVSLFRRFTGPSDGWGRSCVVFISVCVAFLLSFISFFLH